MKRRILIIAAAVAVALGITAGIAVAATSSAPSVCVTHGPGAGATGNYMLWNWDRTACPGNTYGITLPAGPQGPAGPAGPGASYYTLKLGPNVVAPGQKRELGFICNQGDTAISGGISRDQAQPGFAEMTESYPTTPNVNGGTANGSGWTVEAFNPGTTKGPITSYIVCAKTS